MIQSLASKENEQIKLNENINILEYKKINQWLIKLEK